VNDYRLQAGPVGYVRSASNAVNHKLTIGEANYLGGQSLRWRLARENGWHGSWEPTPEAAVDAALKGALP